MGEELHRITNGEKMNSWVHIATEKAAPHFGSPLHDRKLRVYDRKRDSPKRISG